MSRLGYVILFVQDLERSVPFYRDLIGLVNLESGWGNYGTDYSLRAAAAFSALGAVLPQDDTYFVVAGDAAHNNYTITFPVSALAPAGQSPR